MELACSFSDQFVETPFNSGVDVFVRGCEGKPSRRKFFMDGSQSKADRGMLFLREDSSLMDRACPGAAPFDILERQTLID
jgi:hypothetical protein